MVPFHEIGIVAMAAAVTMALRFLPFLCSEETGRCRKASGILPGPAMRDDRDAGDLLSAEYGCFCRAPRASGDRILLLVAVLHLWKRNTLISIAAGTAFYMFLVQAVF